MSELHHVEALLFDLGGVFIDIDFDHAFQYWENQSELSFNEIRRRFVRDAAYEKHERGEIDASEYFEHLRNVLELNTSDEDIALGWNAIFVGEISKSLNYIQSVKDQWPCFAFTNSNPTHQIAWMAAYPDVVAAFRRIFVSSELGLRKPERAAFASVVEDIGISSSAILFFDDTLENVKGAIASGLQAVHVRESADVKNALISIGALTE